MDRNTKRMVDADPTVKALRRRLRFMQIEHAPGITTVRRATQAAIQAVLDRAATATR